MLGAGAAARRTAQHRRAPPIVPQRGPAADSRACASSSPRTSSPARLTAVEAAEAIAEGWRRRVPGTEVDLAPLSDGGPGFVEVVRTPRSAATTVPAVVTGPLGEPVPAEVLLVDARRRPHRLRRGRPGLRSAPRARRPARRRRARPPYGVGELLAAAVDAGATRVRRRTRRLGHQRRRRGHARRARRDRAPTGRRSLRDGGGGLRRRHRPSTSPRPAPGWPASSSSRPPTSTTRCSASRRQRGLRAAEGRRRERRSWRSTPRCEAWSRATDPSLVDRARCRCRGRARLRAAAARRAPGSRASRPCSTSSASTARAAAADVVVTGEGSFDWQSLRGKVVSGVAESATRARPPVRRARRPGRGRPTRARRHGRRGRLLGHRPGGLGRGRDDRRPPPT